MSTTIKTAESKPNKLLTGYISIRVPELKHIYRTLEGPQSVSEITSKFGRPSAAGKRETSHVEDCLKFLNAVDLVESPNGDIRDTVEPINDDLFPGLPFETRLLYHCTWQVGRQAHFAALHRALISDGSRTVDAGRDTLRTILKRETDYEFSWTDEKLDMWITLCQQLGLLSETEDGLVMSPCRALMHDAFLLAPDQTGGDADYNTKLVENGEFQSTLNWIHDNLFSIYVSRTGTPRVHPAVADVLRNMENDEVLSLSSKGDAQHKVTIPPEDLEKDSRGNRRGITHFSIQSRPSETAYDYPLEQHLSHQ